MESQEEIIQAISLPIDDSPQVNPWGGSQVLTPDLNSGDQEDTLYVDNFTHIRAFKFNHKTQKFSFVKAMPKRLAGGERTPLDQQSRSIDYGDKGVIFNFMKSSQQILTILTILDSGNTNINSIVLKHPKQKF